jgi:hypothetical protein
MVERATIPMPSSEPSNFTSFERISLNEIQSPVVKQGANYWTRLRATRRFPSRDKVHPRDIASILPHTHLIKVLDGGDDFLFRIAGDSQVQALKIAFVGKRLSELMPESIEYGLVMKGLLGFVAQFGEPAIIRGQMGPGFSHVNFVYCETAFLPLGERDDTVDHILGFSAYVAPQ